MDIKDNIVKDEGLINKKEEKRNVNLDLIRCVANFFVICVHFFLYIGFYATKIEGRRMYVMVLMRIFFLICVPLFYLLTGFLMNKKELSGKYYKGLIKTLSVYIIISLACNLFKKYYLKMQLTAKQIIFSLFDFSGANYSWYIEMYIGLFLIIPFINLIYNNLKNKSQKKWLIATMLVLTTLPTLCNIFYFESLDWWKNPTIEIASLNKLVPSWWTGIYPITYYFIGAYIAEYRPKIKTVKNLIWLFIAVIAFGTFNYYRSYKTNFVCGTWTDYNSFENITISVLAFILMLNLDLSKLHKPTKKLLERISNLSLSIYLVSWIADQIVYGKLNGNVLLTTDRLNYFPIVVLIIFISSLLMSMIIIPISKYTNKLIFKMCDKIILIKKINKEKKCQKEIIV